jgi:hypothetical protein
VVSETSRRAASALETGYRSHTIFARYTEIRRNIVGERQQLGSLLKGYFPLMMELFPSKPPLMTTLIKRCPTLEKLKRVHPKTLRAFLKENGMRNQDKQTEVFEAVRAAIRALAFKWIRIMFKLWKTHSIYDEAQYIEQLKKRNSPLIKFIQNT